MSICGLMAVVFGELFGVIDDVVIIQSVYKQSVILSVRKQSSLSVRTIGRVQPL